MCDRRLIFSKQKKVGERKKFLPRGLLPFSTNPLSAHFYRNQTLRLVKLSLVYNANLRSLIKRLRCRLFRLVFGGTWKKKVINNYILQDGQCATAGHNNEKKTTDFGILKFLSLSENCPRLPVPFLAPAVSLCSGVQFNLRLNR